MNFASGALIGLYLLFTSVLIVRGRENRRIIAFFGALLIVTHVAIIYYENDKIAQVKGGTFANYSYTDQPSEVPLKAMLGDKNIFMSWRNQFRLQFQSWVESSIADAHPQGVTITLIQEREKYDLFKITYSYQEGHVLSGVETGGILAVPHKVDEKKPLVVAIHGHEEPNWGKLPTSLFSESNWGSFIAHEGYMVFAPISMYHAEIEKVVDPSNFLMAWTKIISNSVDTMQAQVLPNYRYQGIAVAGLSSGGQIASCLMAYRNDITAGVFAGNLYPLDFLRTSYRIAGHPECWDIRGIYDYSPIWALIAPRAVVFQMGRKDPFYPAGQRLEPVGTWFKGTPRAVGSHEVGGMVLILKALWQVCDNPNGIVYEEHDGGHTFDAWKAIDFFRSVYK